MSHTTQQSSRLLQTARRLALFTTLFVTVPANADIDLRVQSRPVAGPIEAFARITDGHTPLVGLTPADFAVTLDGQALAAFTLALPPSQEPTQKISVVFVVTDPTGVGAFISQMAVGDYASIVTFRVDLSARYAPIDVQPFTQIDGGTGNAILGSFLEGVYRRDPEDTRPEIIDLAAALNRAIDQVASPGLELPDGPKAIVVVKPNLVFYQLRQQSDVVAYANSMGLPIFTIFTTRFGPVEPLRYSSIAEATGGSGFAVSDVAESSQALRNFGALLKDAYRLQIPASAVTDCNAHVLEIAVRGQTESVTFARCDATPDDPHFADKDDVALGKLVVSDAVTITGIDGAAAVNVFDGEVSIGCNSSFTSDPTLALPNESVCVRHTSGQFHDEPTYTSLVVGGVPSYFFSTTESSPPDDDGGGGGGGGGPAGFAELLLLLGLLVAQQSRLRAKNLAA